MREGLVFLNLIKFAIYLIVFGSIFYLIHLYDRDLVVLWGDYEIEISTVFLCFTLLVFLIILLKITSLIITLFKLPSRLQNFLSHKRDVGNVKLLLEGYYFLLEGELEQAIKTKNQLNNTIKNDPLFEPFKEEYVKFSKLCHKQK